MIVTNCDDGSQMRMPGSATRMSLNEGDESLAMGGTEAEKLVRSEITTYCITFVLNRTTTTNSADKSSSEMAVCIPESSICKR